MKFILLATLFSFSYSALSVVVPENYRSGVEVCENRTSSKEYALWLSVPVDYSNPARGKTNLYAWTNKPFNPALKTMIFVSGGPGDTAHKSALELSDWNVVFFDQRGIACSRPATRELYLDRSFYSSEFIAHDIEQIRQKLKVDQVSVYGTSYGTVPAHLYGHFYPNRTRAIVLEGIVNQGGKELMRPERRNKALQEFFDALPVASQKRILEISSRSDVAPNWFSNVGKMMLYMDDFATVFDTFLNNIIWQDSVLVPMLKSFEPKEEMDEEYYYGHVMMGMIGCQELGMNQTGLSFYSVFEGNKLVSDEFNDMQKYYCESLGFEPDEETTLYRAKNYPSASFTTYIQGSTDGATSLDQALLHFNQATTGKRQFVLIDKGGHVPLIGPASSGYEKGEGLELRLNILRQALSGKKISEQSLKDISDFLKFNWTLTSRN